MDACNNYNVEAASTLLIKLTLGAIQKQTIYGYILSGHRFFISYDIKIFVHHMREHLH